MTQLPEQRVIEVGTEGSMVIIWKERGRRDLCSRGIRVQVLVAGGVLRCAKLDASRVRKEQ